MKPKQKTVTIGGIEFTFQHPGIAAGLDIIDDARGENGRIRSRTLYTSLMEHVIVNPKTNWEYWEDDDKFAIMEDVMAEAFQFLTTRK